jgi:D-3-phosphoglycerate dehydrogenase
MAVRARAFGMRVIAYDPYATTEMASDGTELVTLDELLGASDVISLHAPMCPETDRIIRDETIAKMKDGVYIINTARGGLVDESALAAALASGKVAGAGLDVFANEPPIGSPLLSAPNVVFSPHVAGISQDSLRRMAVMGAQTIVDLFEGRWPAERIINAEQIGPDWKW